MASQRIYCSYGDENPTIWRIEQEYARATSIGVISVRPGFLFDGASIPRHFQDIIPPWGLYSGAALCHDALYTSHPEGVTREDADRVFRELMIRDGVPEFQARMMWFAVREFGQAAWDSPEEPAQAALVSVTSFAQEEPQHA